MKRLLLTLLLGVAGAGAAQTYPERPVRAIIPNAAGGANDIVGRIVLQKMGGVLGQQLVVDNRGGAGGAIGAEIAARSAPDGYTLLVATFATHAIIPHLQKRIAYDPIGDFDPVSLLAVQYAMMTLAPTVPAASVQQLVALARAKPGQLNYATAGPGSTSDFMGRMFAKVAGIDVTIINYKGGAAIVPALMSGEAHFNFGPIPAMSAHVKAGRVKAIAVSGPKRSLAQPDLPTVSESGLPDFSAAAWVGLVVPRGTHGARIERLAAAASAAVKSADTREQLIATGADPDGRTTRAFGEFIRSEHARYGKIVRELGLGGR